MPPVNVYYNEPEHGLSLAANSDSVRELVAVQLSVPDFPLRKEDVSIRLIQSLGANMIAPVELDIFAAPHNQRVEIQDEICDRVRAGVLNVCPTAGDARVWLMLGELGYSIARK